MGHFQSSFHSGAKWRINEYGTNPKRLGIRNRLPPSVAEMTALLEGRVCELQPSG
jgi:hypothetical protein